MGTFPAISAGQRITSALLTSMLPLTVIKTSNQTVTSSTVLVADNQLTLPVTSSGTYFLDAFFIYSGASGGTADLKADWLIPAGGTLQWAPWSATPGANANALDTLVKTAGTTYALGTFGASVMVGANVKGYYIGGGTAGNVALEWAQNTSNATATTMYSGSWLRLTRVS